MNAQRPGAAGGRGGSPRAQLPLLDRLLDADPGASEMPTPSTAEALERLHTAVRRDLEALLNARRRFEPRLTKITVTLIGEQDGLGGTLRLKVDAVLRADPIPEPVSFETLLEPVTRDVTVRET